MNTLDSYPNLPEGFSSQLAPALTWQHVDSIDSTNAYLLDSQQVPNQLLSAERQTNGRGRRQQRWVDDGESALFSLSKVFDTTCDIGAWPVQVALTLAEALNALLAHAENRERQPDVQIKWPNDLYCLNQAHGQWGKCGGILVESTISSGVVGQQSGKVVTGVGLNLSPVKTAIDSDYPIAFIRLPLPKQVLIVVLANGLFRAWQAFIQHPHIATERYQRIDRLWGQALVATDMNTGEQQHGIGAGVNANGHLLLRQNEKTLALTTQQRIRLAND